MKKTDLYKSLALKTAGLMKQSITPDRFAAGAQLDRKAQRKLDQAKGLIPFAIKLDARLATAVREYAVAEQSTVDDAVARLLQQSLGIPNPSNPSS
ncbi:MAG: hypothetical protein ACK5NY_05550 [Burkholderiaceae bacterium]|jgi:hypothetical protein